MHRVCLPYCQAQLRPQCPTSLADTSQSFAYDKAAQECKLCPAGTYRNYGASTECTPCPAGTYSAEGDKACSPCPPGEVRMPAWATTACHPTCLSHILSYAFGSLCPATCSIPFFSPQILLNCHFCTAVLPL